MTEATLWCNGSTNDFGSFSRSSNLCGVAIFFALKSPKKRIRKSSLPYKKNKRLACMKSLPPGACEGVPLSLCL